MNYLFKNYNRLKSVLLVIAVTLTQSLFANDFNFNIEAEATLISGNHEVFNHNNASAHFYSLRVCQCFPAPVAWQGGFWKKRRKRQSVVVVVPQT